MAKPGQPLDPDLVIAALVKDLQALYVRARNAQTQETSREEAMRILSEIRLELSNVIGFASQASASMSRVDSEVERLVREVKQGRRRFTAAIDELTALGNKITVGLGEAIRWEGQHGARRMTASGKR